MTNPRDPEGLMPAAGVDGPRDLDRDEPPTDDAPVGEGLDREALAGRTDMDRFGGDPDVRYAGDAEDPSMTTDRKDIPERFEP